MKPTRITYRLTLAIAAALAAGTLAAQEKSAKPGAKPAAANLDVRYGIKVDLKKYPQSTPQEAVESILKAGKEADMGYIFAQLMRPDGIDRGFSGDMKKFQRAVATATGDRDKGEIKDLFIQLNGISKEGKWTIRSDKAWARALGCQSFCVQKTGDRWFLCEEVEPGAKLDVRYEIKADLKEYPQSTPQQAAESILKACKENDELYLYAQLMEPADMDNLCRGSVNALEREVRDFKENDNGTPKKHLVKELNNLLKTRNWTVSGDKAVLGAKAGFRASFKRIDDRWFLCGLQEWVQLEEK
jgi:hypothetical protein